MTRAAARALVAAVALAVAPAAATACRLALVMAVDTSRSVDSREFALQFSGIAAAFRDVEVRRAIFATEKPVAVAGFEWSGPGIQVMVTDWVVLNHGRDADRLASAFEAHSRKVRGHKTAIGAAALYAHELLARGPDCARRTIDVSGDGYNNSRPDPAEAYSARDFSAITVNALVVSGLRRPALLAYFETEVIRGPGAFAEATEDFDDYEEAIKRKLLRELAPVTKVAAAGGGG